MNKVKLDLEGLLYELREDLQEYNTIVDNMNKVIRIIKDYDSDNPILIELEKKTTCFNEIFDFIMILEKYQKNL